jgi:hypothetical protein
MIVYAADKLPANRYKLPANRYKLPAVCRRASSCDNGYYHKMTAWTKSTMLVSSIQ